MTDKRTTFEGVRVHFELSDRNNFPNYVFLWKNIYYDNPHTSLPMLQSLFVIPTTQHIAGV